MSGQKVANAPLGSFLVLANEVDGYKRQLVQLDIGGDDVSSPVTNLNPFPIGLIPTALTPLTPAQVTIGATSALIIAANPNRRGLTIQNLSTGGQRVTLCFTGSAVLDTGSTIYPGGHYELDLLGPVTTLVNGIASASGAIVSIQEFE